MENQVKVHFFGEMNHLPERVVEKHFHTVSELVFYDSGNGDTTVGTAKHSFVPGTVLLLPPLIHHGEYYRTESHVVFIGFTSPPRLSPPPDRYSDEDGNLRRLFSQFFEEARECRPLYPQMLEITLSEILLRLMRKKSSSSSENDGILYAANYINEFYAQPVSIQALAKNSGYGYDYFHHLFKKVTGLSPTQYLIRRRLMAAAALIYEGKANCTEAAYRCGFSNNAQFSTMFKRHYGYSPSEILEHGIDPRTEHYLNPNKE